MPQVPGSARQFGKWLDITMENEGFTNRQLASRVGVHESITSRWRSGQSKPSLESCEALAEALGVDFLRLAVTAGLMKRRIVHAEPLPVPPATALKARIRVQLEAVRGMTPTAVQAAMDQWERDMEGER